MSPISQIELNEYLNDIRKWMNIDRDVSDETVIDIVVKQVWLELRKRNCHRSEEE